HLRVIEASYNPWERVFDGVDVTPSLQLQVHMLKARPRALPRRADRADPLATLDILPDPYGDLGEVAIDRSEAVWIMVDNDDQPGTSGGHGRKGKSRNPLGYPRRGGAREHQYDRRRDEPKDLAGAEAARRSGFSHGGSTLSISRAR